MDYREIAAKSKDELKNELLRLKEELHAFSVKVKMNEAKEIHKLKAFKKDIARVLTALRTK